jgi:hypothetical protein
MIRDPQASSCVGDGRDVKPQSNKENLSEREGRAQDIPDASSRGSSTVSIRQTHRPEETSNR